MNPNWAEQVTAIATAIGCIGLTSTLVLAVLAARQLREAQRGRHAQLAADFIRRWDEPALVEARRLVAEHADGGELAATFATSVAENSMAAYVLMRELDFYEQLGALDHVGAFDFELIDALIGNSLVARWELWRPTVDAMGDDAYPMFRALAGKCAASGPQPRDGRCASLTAGGWPPPLSGCPRHGPLDEQRGTR